MYALSKKERRSYRVHREAQKTFDISADLNEFARTPVTVICSGPKAILDIPLTLEFCMCDKFYIEKVLDIHVVTSKFSFEKEMTEINQYIRENNILPKTATYSFLEKDDNEMIDTHIIFGI